MQYFGKRYHISYSPGQRAGRLGNVLAFVFALTVFFLFGFYILAPWIQNRSSSNADSTNKHSATQSPPNPKAHAPHRIPTVSVEVTERPSSVAKSPPAQPSLPPEPTLPSVTQSRPPQQPTRILTQQLDKSIPPHSQPEEPATTNSESASPKLYRVKAGVFHDRANADALLEKLAQNGFSAKIVTDTADGNERYTIQVGAFTGRANADNLAASLRSSGFEAVVSSPE